MAVGVFNRSNSEADMSKAYPSMMERRRNGMANIFNGHSNEEITHLKERFMKRAEDVSSGSDMDIESEPEILSENIDTESEVDLTSSTDEDSTDSEDSSLRNECAMITKRRVALADIFEGVPENDVNDFLSQYSTCDLSENSEFDTNTSNTKHMPRRHAMWNIFEGVQNDKLNDLRERFFGCTNGYDSDETHSLPDGELFHRRGAVADIFQDISDDLIARLTQHLNENLTDSLSEDTDSQTDSDDSESQINGISTDIPSPQLGYLWRRRFALANIFEDVDTCTTNFHVRAQ